MRSYAFFSVSHSAHFDLRRPDSINDFDSVNKLDKPNTLALSIHDFGFVAQVLG